MARRSKNETTVSLQQGYYKRRLGTYLRNDRPQSKVFVLGRDEKQAVARNLLMEKLWDLVVADAERQQQELLRRFDTLARNGSQLLRSPEDPTPMTREEIEQARPHWTDETLVIAEVARRGETRVPIAPEAREMASLYAERMADLSQRFPGFTFTATDPEALRSGQAAHARVHAWNLADLTQQIAESARVAQVPVGNPQTGQTLYEAFEAYAQRALRKDTEHARVEAACARRLKDACADTDLAEFGYTAIERIKDYWVARPQARLANGKSSGRAISVHTVERHVKTARRFVAWLDETDQYEWQLPRHGLRALRVNLNRLHTAQEVSQRRHGVQTFSVEHLTVIWQHASDTERLLVLLGLNAAMAQAEAIGLRWNDVENSTIKRIRHKSGVYGEFALWPETVKALAWWKGIRKPQTDLVLMTAQGRPHTRQRIANAWAQLCERISRETGEKPGWWLPYKHLRKTAAQLVRDASDGEIAAVFLSHGQPVKSDDLSDIYSRRPFDKVSQALGKVCGQLQPMFAAVDDAFTSKQVGGRGPRKRE